MSTDIDDFIKQARWPSGFAKLVKETRNQIAFRFVIVDNSRSMLKHDGHRIVYDRHSMPYVEECTRYKEVAESTRVIATLAEAAALPTEIRLLNNSDPVIVGVRSNNNNSSSSNLSRVMAQLNQEPSGTTPMCRQLHDIIASLHSMEGDLRSTNKIALLIIMTDCESTDGNIVDVLKPLEGMPLQIVIRMCTDERAVTEYWHNINAQLDLDIYVLDHMDIEAVEVMENNNWLTYAEPLHRMREFGVLVPAINYLDYRQLTRIEIKTVLETLIGGPSLPDPEDDWLAFVDTSAAALQKLPLVYCSCRNEPHPWVDIEQLAQYEPDPVGVVVQINEALLWKIYIFYAFNSSALRKFESSSQSFVKLKPAPVFRSAAKYEKRLLHQDDLWKMMKHFDFVPTIVNTIRFNKLMLDVGQRRNDQDKIKIRLCFREVQSFSDSITFSISFR